ncbi:MAG TPA: hypothetical protein VFE53_05385 [Mucilaginibacter sp.]|jgi:hypothetical protein|nr:hypothetical protein [Mucilaginibacter sp.]
MASATPDSVVTSAYAEGSTATMSAGIGDVLVVHVKNLDIAKMPGNTIKQIRLFINSMEIVDSAPMGWCQQGDGSDVKFLLDRTEANDKTWNTILGYPELGKGFFKLDVGVSIGLTGQTCWPTTIDATNKDKAFHFVRIYSNWFWFCLVIVIVYFAVFFTYAKKTPMLRDAPADLSPLGIPGLDAGNAPFSLGKVQMAFWFSIVVTSYLFIWLITGDYELITPGTLVLIGIGAGTALGAVSINNNKSSGTVKQIQDLQAQQSELQQATALLGAAPGPGVDGKIAYNNFLDHQLSTKINKLIDSLTQGKDNFINDILTDENGVSFHRLQMVVFTAVLGLVFIYEVWANLTMPDFSPTLLTMQGITAGTYLGFKIPEKQS